MCSIFCTIKWNGNGVVCASHKDIKDQHLEVLVCGIEWFYLVWIKQPHFQPTAQCFCSVPLSLLMTVLWCLVSLTCICSDFFSWLCPAACQYAHKHFVQNGCSRRSLIKGKKSSAKRQISYVSSHLWHRKSL